MSKPESPTVVAHRLGLQWKKGPSGATLTWDHVLDLAVKAYWKRRDTKQLAS